MRLDEIISSNMVVIKCKQMQYNFSNDFDFINSTYIFLSKSKSLHRLRPILNNIEDLENRINLFLNYDFDPDSDIDALKETARNILINLDDIKR